MPYMSAEEMEQHRERFSDFVSSKRFSPYVQSLLPPFDRSGDELNDVFAANDRKRLKELRAHVFPGRTRNTVLCTTGSNDKDYKFALDLFNEHVLKFAGKDGKQRQRQMQASNRRDGNKHRVAIRGPPIIVVPNSLTGAISSYNAMDFLGPESKWISIEEKKKSGGKREKELRVRHTFQNSSTIEFLVLDDPRKLQTDSDWQRVVAVFALGQPWQFKEWKWSNPVDLFQHTMGVHLMLDNDKVAKS